MATKRCTSKRTGKKVSCARQRAGKKAASSRRAGGRRAGAGGKGRYALVKSEGMDQWILSRHTTEAAAEKAMRKRGGEPGSMFTRGMRIAKVGPDDPTEAIKIFGRWTTRPRHGGLFARFARGHRAVDEHAARELELFIDNDYQLTNRRKPEFIKNALRKVKSGKYSVALAPKLWIYYVDEGAKQYAKEFGGSWHTHFPKETREYVAQEYANEFDNELDLHGSWQALADEYGVLGERGLKG